MSVSSLDRLRDILEPPEERLAKIASGLHDPAYQHEQRRQTVRLADLQVDHDYQRPPDREKVQGMLEAIKTGKKMEALRVNERPDGSLWITDGQHRAIALGLAGETHHDADVTREPSQHEQRRANILTPH